MGLILRILTASLLSMAVAHKPSFAKSAKGRRTPTANSDDIERAKKSILKTGVYVFVTSHARNKLGKKGSTKCNINDMEFDRETLTGEFIVDGSCINQRVVEGGEVETPFGFVIKGDFLSPLGDPKFKMIEFFDPS